MNWMGIYCLLELVMIRILRFTWQNIKQIIKGRLSSRNMPQLQKMGKGYGKSIGIYYLKMKTLDILVTIMKKRIVSMLVT